MNNLTFIFQSQNLTMEGIIIIYHFSKLSDFFFFLIIIIHKLLGLFNFLDYLFFRIFHRIYCHCRIFFVIVFHNFRLN